MCPVACLSRKILSALESIHETVSSRGGVLCQVRLPVCGQKVPGSCLLNNGLQLLLRTGSTVFMRQRPVAELQDQDRIIDT